MSPKKCVDTRTLLYIYSGDLLGFALYIENHIYIAPKIYIAPTPPLKQRSLTMDEKTLGGSREKSIALYTHNA